MAKQQTLVDALQNLYNQFGHYRAQLISKTFDSTATSDSMDELIAQIGQNGLDKIDG